MAKAKVYDYDEVVGDINCLICLREYKNPRTLPCMHTFCQHCLSDYIVGLNLEKEKIKQFLCPFCRQEVKPPFPEKSTKEWAATFKQSPLLIAMLSQGESKVEYLCCMCQLDGRFEPMTNFCVTCKEGFCTQCTKYHVNLKATKGHIFESKDQMIQNPQEIMKLLDIFTCVEHDGEEIKFYCEDHKAECCVSCFLQEHRTCSKVHDLKLEAKQMIAQAMRSPEQSIHEMKTLGAHLHKITQADQTNVAKVHAQGNELKQEIHALRIHLNGLLDKLEQMVDVETTLVYKEADSKKADNSHRCLSMAAAIRSSCRMLELVSQHGSDTQLFLTLTRSDGQLKNYKEQVASKFQDVESVDLGLELHPYLKELLSFSADDAAKVKIGRRKEAMPVRGKAEKKRVKPLKECQIVKTGEVNVQCPLGGDDPWYIGATYIPGGNVMLVDRHNNRCCLYDNNFEHVSHYTFHLTEKYNLWDVSLVSDAEVVVSVPGQKKLQFLSVVQEIKPTRSITTRFKCCGVVTLDKDRIIVSGGTDTDKYYWSIISTSGEELSYHKMDEEGGSDTYLSMNDSRTHIYMSCYLYDTLFCFDLEGEPIFTYKRNDLNGPRGVGLDAEDNIYLVNSQHNMHQLLPDGAVLKVIEAEIPQNPQKICFCRISDCFFITSGNILCLYQFQ